MLFQQLNVFLFECLMRMMLQLIFDVMPYTILLRRANGERSKPILPAKLLNQTARSIDMFTCSCFHFADKI